MDKWEYTTVVCEDTKMEALLRKLGEQGWEAVGFAPVTYIALHPPVSAITGAVADIGMVTEWEAQQYRVLLKRRKA